MRLILTVAFAAALFSTIAIAGPLTEGAASAEGMAANDPAGAASAARVAAADFVAKLPLNAANITFVAASPDGFKMYDARESVFKAGEPLITYAEIGGLDWKVGGRGAVSGFNADLQLMAADGTVLAEQLAFGNFSFDAKQPVQEVMAVLTLNANGLSAGDYKVRYILKDANSDDTTEIEQAFKIAD